MRRMTRGAALLTIALLAAGCAADPAPQRSEAPVPAPPGPAETADPAPPPAEAAVDAMSVEEQAASVVMGHVPTTDTGVLHDYMSEGLGGFILMGANIPDGAEQLREVTAALVVDEERPPLIAIDQEGGDVSRLPWDDGAAGRHLQAADPAETTAAFTARAGLVADAGANVNFGVVADVPADAASFIASRALGADPAGAAERVAAAVAAEKGVVYSTLKHFPGHGAAPGDSHHGIPSTGMGLEQWRQSDGLPFFAGVEAGAELLMFGHLAYTAVDAAPATLSARWHEIARTELGFEGVIVTDDLGMLLSSGVDAYADPVRNAVDSIAAGNDMVLMIAGSTPETAGEMAAGIAAAVEEGEIPAERLRDAAVRVMELRLQLAERG